MRIRAYQFTAFLSAFLLFLVQPMASKALLPVFGGSYLVWGTCMVFFQGMLLAGYVYAHLAQSRLGVFRYSRWHWLLLLVAFAAFPFRFAGLENVPPGPYPAFDVVARLAFLIGLPFFALSTMSLVLQRWLSASHLPDRKNPYILYSPSNLGSLLALLCYPTVIEPRLNLEHQAVLWWAGFGTLFVLQFICRPRGNGEPDRAETTGGEAVTRAEMLRWGLLSAAGTAVLLAVTNVITFNVASVPFLWVLPLCVYLLTFVLVFRRRMWLPAWMEKGFNWSLAVAVLLWCMTGMRLDVPAPVSLALQLLILFCVCMNCHGALVRRKPANPAHMTLFYTLISLGGFCGSLLVNWIVPLVSSTPVEYLLSFVLATAALGMHDTGPNKGGLPALAIGAAILAFSLTAVPAVLGGHLRIGPQWILPVALLPVVLVVRFFRDRPRHLAALLAVALAASSGTEALMFGATNTLRFRNFYGIYKVYDRDGIRHLQHGTTLHGREYLDPERAGIPLSYFHPTAPAGELLASGFFRPGRTGMIGLGTGAMAMYFRDGQELTIYELDPDNVPIARERFGYLRLAEANRAKLSIVTGDGRLSLRKEADRKYDLLLLDAFSSDSIPVHLLTREAMSEYLRVLQPDGLLLLHISNRVLDLEPVVFSAARSLGLRAAAKSNDGAVDPDADMSTWMAVGRGPGIYRILGRVPGWRGEPEGKAPLPRPWTDRYSNVFGRMIERDGAR